MAPAPYPLLLNVQGGVVGLVDGLGDVGGADAIAHLTNKWGATAEGINIGRMAAVTLFVTFVFSIKICGVVSSTKL